LQRAGGAPAGLSGGGGGGGAPAMGGMPGMGNMGGGGGGRGGMPQMPAGVPPQMQNMMNGMDPAMMQNLMQRFGGMGGGGAAP
jgi:hypothetical protein